MDPDRYPAGINPEVGIARTWYPEPNPLDDNQGISRMAPKGIPPNFHNYRAVPKQKNKLYTIWLQVH